MNRYFDIVNKYYKIQKEDIGEFKNFEVQGLKFDNNCYYIEGIGRLSTMQAKTDNSMMSMDSFIINPFEVDAPLLSLDRVKAFGTDTILCEMYDTTINKNFDVTLIEDVKKKYGTDKDVINNESHWYDSLTYETNIVKKGDKNDEELFDSIVLEFLKQYVETIKNSEKCDEAKKRIEASKYTSGLLENGGPAASPVKLSLGEEKANAFFHNYLFGDEK